MTRANETIAMAMTVKGPVDTNALGITLPHEHIFIDIRNQYTEADNPEKAAVGRESVSMPRLGMLRRDPYALRDNLVIDDVELAFEELGFFKAAGGKTVIDCTSVGAGRDIGRLQEVAERTGLNIIAGCGYYTGDTHPPELADFSSEEIAAGMTKDLTEGIDNTGIKAGMIGEIGTSDPITENEKKVLSAAAYASKETNVPINVHTYPWCRSGLEIVDHLLAEGAVPEKIVICHTDVQPNLPYIKSLLSQGVFVQFDNFGKEFYINKADRAFAGGNFVTDLERVRTINTILEWGFASQILITNDLCLKSMLRAFGGWGYDHILTNIVPMMLDEGIPQSTINGFLIDNPARMFH